MASPTLPDDSSSLAAARLAAIVESSDDAIVSKDLKGTILSWNRAAEHIFGYTSEEMIGKSVYLLVPPDIHHEERYVLDQITRGERVAHYETRRLHKSGRIVPIALTVSPVRNAAGVIVGAASIKRDISERRATAEMAARLAAIIQSSDDAIISKTIGGKVLTWNPSAERMYGYSAQEMIGQSIFTVVPADLREDERRILEQVAGGSHLTHYETRRVRKDGQEIIISLTISPMRDAGGLVVGASSIKRDITAQKRTEETLRQTAKMEAIGRLAGGLAHDYNNQLHALQGLTSFIASDPGLTPSSRGDLAEIKKTHERMASLTTQLLAFARQQVLNPETLDVNATVEDTKPLLQRLIGSSVQIHLGLAEEGCWVKVDRAQLVQVLMNLVINARDAMPRGGTINVETRIVDIPPDTLDQRQRVTPPGKFVELRVTDTGEGIPPDILNRIFDPFFTTKAVGRGTGLGLATVEGIVSQSGGIIDVESQVGSGTSFRVLLSCVHPLAETKDNGGPATTPSAGQERILVVDDEELVRRIVTRVLEGHGYSVLGADNGKAALAILADREVDLIISDVVMPIMGGLEVAAELARCNNQIPVLWMSGHPRDIGASSPMQSQPFLQKPISPDVLVNAVEQILQDHRLVRESLSVRETH
ncbi:MAG: PAS domain S-box protein [Gemmatimonadota bacterium]